MDEKIPSLSAEDIVQGTETAFGRDISKAGCAERESNRRRASADGSCAGVLPYPVSVKAEDGRLANLRRFQNRISTIRAFTHVSPINISITGR